jgi:hypothetical protein
LIDRLGTHLGRMVANVDVEQVGAALVLEEEVDQDPPIGVFCGNV